MGRMIDEDDLASYETKDGAKYWAVSYPDDEDTENDDENENPESNGNRTENERQSNGGRTAIERQSNGNRTAIERQSNDEQTKIERYNQLAAANRKNAKLQSETPSDFVEWYSGIVECLNDKKFIDKVIGVENLNFFSVPQPLQLAINQRLGANYKNHIINKCWYSLLFCKQVRAKNRWMMLAIILMLIISGAIAAAWYGSKPAALEKATSKVQLSPEQHYKDSLYILDWATKNRQQFTGYRYKLMLKDPNFVNGDNNARIEIMRGHVKAQQEVMDKTTTQQK